MVHKIGRGGPSPLPQETPVDNVNTSTSSETKTPALAPEENRHPTSATEQNVRTAKFTELQLTGMARAAELSNFKQAAPEKGVAQKYTMFQADGTPLRARPEKSESNKIDAFTFKEKTIEDPTGEPQTPESKAWHMANFRMTIDTSSTNEATEPRRTDDTDAHNKSEKK